MPGKTLSDTYRPAGHVRYMTEEAGAVLLDLKAGKYFSLNEVGVEIWRRIEAGADYQQILDHLNKSYAADVDDLRRDLDGFVGGLQAKGLIRAIA